MCEREREDFCEEKWKRTINVKVSRRQKMAIDLAFKFLKTVDEKEIRKRK